MRVMSASCHSSLESESCAYTLCELDVKESLRAHPSPEDHLVQHSREACDERFLPTLPFRGFQDPPAQPAEDDLKTFPEGTNEPLCV